MCASFDKMKSHHIFWTLLTDSHTIVSCNWLQQYNSGKPTKQSKKTDMKIKSLLRGSVNLLGKTWALLDWLFFSLSSVHYMSQGFYLSLWTVWFYILCFLLFLISLMLPLSFTISSHCVFVYGWDDKFTFNFWCRDAFMSRDTLVPSRNQNLVYVFYNTEGINSAAVAVTCAVLENEISPVVTRAVQ